MNRTKVFLISSSTGGHALPVYKLAEELKLNNYEVIVIHTSSVIEREIFTNYKCYILRSGKTNTIHASKRAIEYLKIIGALFASFYFLAKERPDLIISKGGFNAVPLLFWARIFKIPYFIHESDIVMGRSNALFAKNAEKVFVSFPTECYSQKYQNMVYSGLIIRDFRSKHKVERKYKKILITGGSQGAKALSDTILEILPDLLRHYIVVHSTGLGGFGFTSECKNKITEDELKRYSEFSFSYNKLEEEMVDSDLIISRAGANAIGEIAKLKKPSILIPYPYAASDHQSKNAKYLEKYGATIIIKQELLKPELLYERINFVLGDQRNTAVLGANIHKVVKTDGADVIIREVKKFLE